MSKKINLGRTSGLALYCFFRVSGSIKDKLGYRSGGSLFLLQDISRAVGFPEWLTWKHLASQPWSLPSEGITGDLDHSFFPIAKDIIRYDHLMNDHLSCVEQGCNLSPVYAGAFCEYVHNWTEGRK